MEPRYTTSVLLVLYSLLGVEALNPSDGNGGNGNYEEYGEDYLASGADYAWSDVIMAEIEHGAGEPQMAFLIKLTGCSAALITKDWAVSATHCIPVENYNKLEDEKGNAVYEGHDLFARIVGGSATKPAWTDPLQAEDAKIEENNGGDWRKVEKIITQDYKGESQIFKGEDLLLVKLEPEWLSIPEGHLAPICLPDPDKPDLQDDLSDQLYYIGFGRRRVPHCLTDERGPDKYYPCGRPVSCSKEHKSKKCGIKFLFEGKEWNKCIKRQKTPSSKNKICRKLLKFTDETDFKTETHVFNPDGSWRTACYPFRIKKGQKGWCATRVPWIDENEEPKVDSGWGYCGESEIQKQCTEYIDDEIKDTSLMPVTRLTNEFCVEQLALNLEQEMPWTPLESFNDLDKARLICIGSNHTENPEDVPAYEYDEDTTEFKKVDLDKKRIESLEAVNRSLTALDGGACFGDSGGPLVKYEEKTPVLIGVMSFLLWGICKSRFDPSYYTRVHSNYDFIFKHVPREEMCFI